MSAKSTLWAFGLTDVSALEKLIAIVLAESDGIDCPCASLEAICKFCNTPEDEVVIALKQLSDRFSLSCEIDPAGALHYILPPAIERIPQTKPSRADESLCCIYVIAALTRTKIGISNNVRMRLENLQAWSPETLRVEWTGSGPRHLIRQIEAACHNALAEYRIVGEWFDVTPRSAIAVVRAEMGKRGLKSDET
jgi:hypothetical protein